MCKIKFLKNSRKILLLVVDNEKQQIFRKDQQDKRIPFGNSGQIIGENGLMRNAKITVKIAR